jgi:hypothetical protein
MKRLIAAVDILVGWRASGTDRTSFRKLGEANLGRERRGIFEDTVESPSHDPAQHCRRVDKIAGMQNEVFQSTQVEHFAQSPSAGEEFCSTSRIFIGGTKTGGMRRFSAHGRPG